MSTTLVKPAEVERKWYLLDATGKSLGHVAAAVSYTHLLAAGSVVLVLLASLAL